jgi:hypothetical protein
MPANIGLLYTRKDNRQHVLEHLHLGHSFRLGIELDARYVERLQFLNYMRRKRLR